MQLIATKFPWFLDTFKSYPYGIQRADALRYFVLYEHGGIYVDLDVVCNKNLDFLRHFEFVTPKTYPVGVSNDIMMAKPHSDFALRLIQQLPTWNVFLFVKYATVMFSTGPMFVTAQYALYAHKERLFIMPVELYGKYKLTGDALFKHLHGSSWHGSDGKYILWIDHNAMLFASLVLLLLVSAATGLLVFCRHRAIARRGNGGGFGDGAGGLAPGDVEDAVRGALHRLAGMPSTLLAWSGLSPAGGGARKGPARGMVPP
ncbi:hypothetical protein DUNSADRAFT_7156 [Dunaliella salina]|uniref:Uncharacterized protein n=1 Tax=Dunaliella salina TaxID=3046 RepID=A0ABQ7GLW8_DUNSA|nr:hypothetical protein DUNSADRAFT_7156 [Dunaliella salina]|eukprot:KAF5835608.1 hypothetical protein DUNSADRAFT_7156 [Dunaliella salina]